MFVKDIMSPRLVRVREDESLDAVARTMLQHDVGSAVVTDAHGHATGILTERDFTAREPSNPFQKNRPTMLFGRNVRRHGLENLYEEARHLTAGKMQRSFAATVSETDTIERAVDLMNRHEILHVPVLRGKECVGMISRHDLLRLAAASTYTQAPATLTH